jgi:hypothetical protein
MSFGTTIPVPEPCAPCGGYWRSNLFFVVSSMPRFHGEVLDGGAACPILHVGSGFQTGADNSSTIHRPRWAI